MAELVPVEFNPFKKSTTPEDFSARYGAAADKAAKALGVDPKVVLGQWGLETGWGKSVIPGTNNLGNIKDFSGAGTAATDNMTGSRDKYRAYESPDQFVDDYVSLIQRKYPNAVNAKTPEDFAKALKSGGYAEDPGYVAKVTTAAKMTPTKAATGPTLEPVDFDPFAKTTPEAATVEPSAAFGVYPKARREAKNNSADALGSIAKGVASGFADVGNTIINSGTKAGADTLAGINDPNGLIDPRFKRATPGAMSQSEQENAARAQGLQQFNEDNKGALFSGGRIAGNIAATYPVGGAISGVARAAGTPRLANALASGGLRTGVPAAPGPAGAIADMGIRMAGGALTGGASAGLIDPSSAGLGAGVGAALPPILRGLGAAGAGIARTVRGPEVPEGVRTAAAAAQAAGYVIPPTQVRPTLVNRLLEGTAGKITTAQNASARNQEVTNRLARNALGIEGDAPLNVEALQQIRRNAGEAYEAVRGIGEIVPDQEFRQALQGIAGQYQGAAQSFPGLQRNEVAQLVEHLNVPNIDSSSAVDAIRVLREGADRAFRTGDAGVGRAHREAAAALEALLERSAAQAGGGEMVQALREARQLIARTYTVQGAMNRSTGTISAPKLANALQRGAPLDGQLRQAAEFSAAFPRASQALEGMGSLPQTSPLDWTAAGGIAAATGGSPVAALGLVARPAARAAALSPFVQNRLAQPQALPMLTQNARQNLLQPLYRSGPVLASDR